MDASILIPVQEQINHNIVISMIEDYKAHIFNPCNKEILVAQNEYGELHVIDGHHRYAACRLINGTQKIIKIISPVHNLLLYLKKLPGVTNLPFAEKGF